MSTGEDQLPQVGPADPWAQHVARSLKKQRAHARRLLDQQREQFEQVQKHILAPFAERHRELEDRQSQLADREAELDTFRTRMEREQTELRQQLAQSHRQLNARADEIKALRKQVGDLTTPSFEQSSNASSPADDDLQRELAELRRERTTLLDQLAETQLELKNRPALQASSQEMDDLRCRFEMAVQDVRELKNRNAELEERLDQTEQSGAGSSTGGAFDWEAQKRKLFAQLDADFDGSDENDSAEKMTIEGTIRITDQVVAEKDREIAELKSRLNQQVGTEALGSAAEVLDADELIRQEREDLRQLQEEWQEKLRKAEIDISVERAKVARERAQLEEKLRTCEAIRAEQEGDDRNVQAGGESSKAPRRRWLTRLGLADDD